VAPEIKFDESKPKEEQKEQLGNLLAGLLSGAPPPKKK
jgi:hypothetical protein